MDIEIKTVKPKEFLFKELELGDCFILASQEIYIYLLTDKGVLNIRNGHYHSDIRPDAILYKIINLNGELEY